MTEETKDEKENSGNFTAINMPEKIPNIFTITKPKSTEQYETPINEQTKSKAKVRDLMSFWLLACCNNFGYTLLLTAAHDILQEGGEYMSEYYDGNLTITRNCNIMSTGSILLAASLPGLFVKLIAPFLPASEHIRMGLTVSLYFTGLLLVSVSPSVWMAILGTAITSLSSGFGEVTCLSHSPFYHKTVLGLWSSGNAASGLLASGSLALLTFFGISARSTLKIMLFIPILMGLVFWVLLSKADKSVNNLQRQQQHEQQEKSGKQLELDNKMYEIPTPMEKLKLLPGLLKYMIPVTSVYFFQYFINQGLTELVQFDNIWLDQNAQYRWIQVVYQLGKFISQSSRGLIRINKIWLLVLFQFLNVIIFTNEVLFYIIPWIEIVFVLAFWEGLVGGSTYVNVLRKISNEIPANKRDFALVMSSLSDSTGITVSGFISIPVHNILCQLPKPNRWSF